MAEYIPEIGKIDSTFLGIEDHGIFSLNVNFQFGGTSQGTGHYSLDFQPVLEEGAKPVVPWGNRLIKAILCAADVDQWERLKGRTLYVLRQERYGLIKGMAPLPTERGKGFVLEGDDILPYEVES